MPDQPTCEDCRFFKLTTSTDVGGECHCHAPSPKWGVDSSERWKWPPTFPKETGCGERKPNGIPPEQKAQLDKEIERTFLGVCGSEKNPHPLRLDPDGKWRCNRCPAYDNVLFTDEPKPPSLGDPCPEREDGEHTNVLISESKYQCTACGGEAKRKDERFLIYSKDDPKPLKLTDPCPKGGPHDCYDEDARLDTDVQQVRCAMTVIDVEDGFYVQNPPMEPDLSNPFRKEFETRQVEGDIGTGPKTAEQAAEHDRLGGFEVPESSEPLPSLKRAKRLCEHGVHFLHVCDERERNEP